MSGYPTSPGLTVIRPVTVTPWILLPFPSFTVTSASIFPLLSLSSSFSLYTVSVPVGAVVVVVEVDVVELVDEVVTAIVVPLPAVTWLMSVVVWKVC